MATGGADKVVKLWDPATGANTGSLRVPFFFLVTPCCTCKFACCLLPVACCLLPAACCLLPAACRLLPAACCLSPVACRLLPVTLLRLVCSVHNTCTMSKPMTENSAHVVALHFLASFVDHPSQLIHCLCVIRLSGLSGLLSLPCGACQCSALLPPALITLPQARGHHGSSYCYH